MKLWSTIGSVASLMAVAANILSEFASKRRIQEEIAKEVAKEIAKQMKNVK